MPIRQVAIFFLLLGRCLVWRTSENAYSTQSGEYADDALWRSAYEGQQAAKISRLGDACAPVCLLC